MKNLLKLLALMCVISGCTENDIKPSISYKPALQPGSEFIFGKTAGPDTFAPTPYNIYKISGGKLFAAYIPRINPDSLNLYPMKALSSDKFKIVAGLPTLLPHRVFSETKDFIGLLNTDSGYDFVKVSLEAGATKFFYLGDGGLPDYIATFKQTLDQDLAKLVQ